MMAGVVGRGRRKGCEAIFVGMNARSISLVFTF